MGPECLCTPSAPTRIEHVRKTGANHKREYWVCVKPAAEACRYFAWADLPPPTQGPPCYCGEATLVKVVTKRGPNSGKLFASCSKPRGTGCTFFEWQGEERSSLAGPPCTCGEATVMARVTEEGATKGNAFWTCARSRGGSTGCAFSAGVDAPPKTKLCSCGFPLRTFTVRKQGPNVGREFLRCSGERGNQCDAFEWAASSSTGMRSRSQPY